MAISSSLDFVYVYKGRPYFVEKKRFFSRRIITVRYSMRLEERVGQSNLFTVYVTTIYELEVLRGLMGTSLYLVSEIRELAPDLEHSNNRSPSFCMC